MSHQTICYNPKAHALTVWPNYAFSRIFRLHNAYYGVRSDGVFKITGNLDQTTEYTTKLTLAKTNFGQMALKRLAYMRVDADGDNNNPLSVSAQYDNDQPTPVVKHEFDAAKRVKLGKGSKGRFIAVTLENKSPNFKLRSIEIYPEILQRGVR